MSAVTHVFKILEVVVAHQDTGVSFSEIVSQSRLPKASAHRFLKELRLLGFLVYDPETGRYRGSLKLAALGAEVMGQVDLRAQFRPHFLALRKETDHTCHIGIRNGHFGVYLDKIESRDYGIKLFSEVGKTFPLHCTGLGKVLLAHAPAEEREAILVGSLAAMTPNTITDRDKLRENLEQVQREGFALDQEEITRGLICVAAPIFDYRGRVIAALSLTLPAYLVAEKGIDAEVSAVKHYARAMSGLLSKDS
jgi:DNA-binding IclR family transcriptional regulator